MAVFQPLGRHGYLLDWIDGGLEQKDQGLVFGPFIRFGREGILFKRKLSMFDIMIFITMEMMMMKMTNEITECVPSNRLPIVRI